LGLTEAVYRVLEDEELRNEITRLLPAPEPGQEPALAVTATAATMEARLEEALGPDVAVTNRHVAEIFANRGWGVFPLKTSRDQNDLATDRPATGEYRELPYREAGVAA
jgi:hypothetical protein